MGKNITVKNRSNGFVVYALPERHIRREFNPRETKQIDYQELVELTAVSGGRELIYNYLLIEDKEAMREILNVQEEPEYWLTEDKIPEWMIKCSLDEFKDGLDFAPEGVRDLIKHYAVAMPLNDVSKRKAVLDILKFDVNKAIEIVNAAQEENEITPTTDSSRRRSSATTIENIATEQPTSKYNVVKRADV